MNTNKNEFQSKSYGLEVTVKFDSLSTATFDELVDELLECFYTATRSHCMTMFRIDYSECETILIETGVDDNNLLSVSMWDVAWGQPDENFYYIEVPLDKPSMADHCAYILGRAYHKIATSLVADYDRNGNPIEHSREVEWNAAGFTTTSSAEV